MGRSQESFHKKEVRNKKEKKKKDKVKRRLVRKEAEKSGKLEDMIAYVDENGNITSTPPDPEKKTEVELEDIQISVPKRDKSEEVDIVRTGVVAFFNDSKGYGFIKDSQNHEKLFVHINNVNGDIREGNKVSFKMEKGPKGPVAVEVEIVK